MKNYVICDIDGTLVDSVGSHAAAWQKAFEKFGKTVEPEAVREQIGKGGDQLMPVFLNEAELNEFGEELQKYRNELFKSDYLPHLQPLPEARTLCARLVADGKRLVLASSASGEELEYFKELLGIEDFLHGETSGDDVKKSKPHPDIFEAALVELGNPAPEEVVVIGDSPYDAIAAQKIGLQTVGFLSGGYEEEWLKKEGCVEVYKSPADLLANYEDSILCCKDEVKSPRLVDVFGSILTA